MRYHDIPPKEWTSYYGSVYRCNHPVYRVCTLYREQGKGLCVIQQRYNEKTKATYWSAIDPWLTDKIYLHEGFRQYFDSHERPPGCCYSKRQTDFLYDGLFPGTRSGFRTSKNNAVRASA